MAKAELDVTELVEETFEKHFGVTLDRLRELAEADKDGRLCIMGVDLAIGSDMTVTMKPPVKSAEAALKAGDKS